MTRTDPGDDSDRPRGRLGQTRICGKSDGSPAASSLPPQAAAAAAAEAVGPVQPLPAAGPGQAGVEVGDGALLACGEKSVSCGPPSVWLCVSLCLCLRLRLCLCLTVSVSVSLAVSVSVSVSICLPFSLSLSLSVCLSASLSLSLFLKVGDDALLACWRGFEHVGSLSLSLDSVSQIPSPPPRVSPFVSLCPSVPLPLGLSVSLALCLDRLVSDLCSSAPLSARVLLIGSASVLCSSAPPSARV
jgi:hypothetical protein